MKWIPLAVAMLVVLLSSCMEERGVSPDLGYDFFPLQVGKSWEYAVDSITYRSDGIPDTANLFFLEQIVAWRIDNVGDTLYIAERFERYDSTQPWQVKEVFSLKRTRTQAIRTENNLSFIKLIFPIKRRDRWDGNKYFDSEVNTPVAGNAIQMFLDWEYIYQNVASNEVMVNSADYELQVRLRKAEEKYAPNVGLTYRHLQILDTQCITCCGSTESPACDTLPWAAKAERGFILEQKLIRHY